MKPILEFYYTAFDKVCSAGYYLEIDQVDAIRPLDEQTADNFFLEYVWCVLNAGMKEQIARKIFNRYIQDFDIEIINHPSKKKAIKDVYSRYHLILHEIKDSKDPIEYLKTLPWIGDITKYHLARNIGIETVKPDRHLVRLAERFGYSSPMEMCQDIKKDNGTKLGTIDVILWRYCNLFGFD